MAYSTTFYLQFDYHAWSSHFYFSFLLSVFLFLPVNRKDKQRNLWFGFGGLSNAQIHHHWNNMGSWVSSFFFFGGGVICIAHDTNIVSSHFVISYMNLYCPFLFFFFG